MKKEIPQTPSISLGFAVLAEELGGMGERAIKDFYLKNWPWLAAIAGGVSALASCAPFPKALANEPTPRAPITQPVEPSAIPTLPPNPTATRSIEENITFAQRLGISFIESNVFNNERVMNELTVGLGVNEGDLSHNYNLQIALAQFGQSPTAAVTDYRLQTEGRQPVWQPVFITDKAGMIKAIVLHNFTKLGAESNRVGVFRIENEDFVAYDVSGKLIAGFTNVGSGNPSKIFFQLVGEDDQLYPVRPGGQEKQTEIMRITAQGDSNGGWIYVYEIIKIPQESNQGFSVAGALLPTPAPPTETPKPTATVTATRPSEINLSPVKPADSQVVLRSLRSVMAEGGVLTDEQLLKEVYGRVYTLTNKDGQPAGTVIISKAAQASLANQKIEESQWVKVLAAHLNREPKALRLILDGDDAVMFDEAGVLVYQVLPQQEGKFYLLSEDGTKSEIKYQTTNPFYRPAVKYADGLGMVGADDYHITHQWDAKEKRWQELERYIPLGTAYERMAKSLSELQPSLGIDPNEVKEYIKSGGKSTVFNSFRILPDAQGQPAIILVTGGKYGLRPDLGNIEATQSAVTRLNEVDPEIIRYLVDQFGLKAVYEYTGNDPQSYSTSVNSTIGGMEVNEQINQPIITSPPDDRKIELIAHLLNEARGVFNYRHLEWQKDRWVFVVDRGLQLDKNPGVDKAKWAENWTNQHKNNLSQKEYQGQMFWVRLTIEAYSK